MRMRRWAGRGCALTDRRRRPRKAPGSATSCCCALRQQVAVRTGGLRPGGDEAPRGNAEGTQRERGAEAGLRVGSGWRSLRARGRGHLCWALARGSPPDGIAKWPRDGAGSWGCVWEKPPGTPAGGARGPGSSCSGKWGAGTWGSWYPSVHPVSCPCFPRGSPPCAHHARCAGVARATVQGLAGVGGCGQFPWVRIWDPHLPSTPHWGSRSRERRVPSARGWLPSLLAPSPAAGAAALSWHRRGTLTRRLAVPVQAS